MKRAGNTKAVIVAGFAVFASILMLSLVSAQYWYIDLRQGAEQVIQWITDIFGPFLSVLFGGGYGTWFLFEKFLFFLIILAFSYVVLLKFPVFDEKKGIVWIITFAVSILATRFITEVEFVKTILLSYTVLGIAITAGVPLIIFFLFVNSFESVPLRKILWIFFSVIFFAVWTVRYDDIGSLAWIYFATGALALLFFFADGTIRRAMIKQQMQQLGVARREDLEREIRREMWQAGQDLNAPIISPQQHKRIMKRLQKQLDAVRKL